MLIYEETAQSRERLQSALRRPWPAASPQLTALLDSKIPGLAMTRKAREVASRPAEYPAALEDAE